MVGATSFAQRRSSSSATSGLRASAVQEEDETSLNVYVISLHSYVVLWFRLAVYHLLTYLLYCFKEGGETSCTLGAVGRWPMASSACLGSVCWRTLTDEIGTPDPN